jgi:hypothetical protein
VNRLASWADGARECFTLGNFLLYAFPALTAKIDGWKHWYMSVKETTTHNYSFEV